MNELIGMSDLANSSKDTFDANRNSHYKKCFDIDIFKICGPKGPEKPVTPKFEAWVRLLVLENVEVDDVTKFKFV